MPTARTATPAERTATTDRISQKEREKGRTRTGIPAPARRGTRQGIPAPARRTPHLYNRLRVLLVHLPRYTIRGQARLAHDVGVSRSTICRLVHARSNPSHALAQRVTDALARHLGRPLDAREVFSMSGAYPTPSGCALCGCHGCLPADAWAEDDTLKAEWRDQRPGDWSFARPMTEEQMLGSEMTDAGETVPQGKEVAVAGKEVARKEGR